MTASNFHTICASSLPSGWVLAPVGAYCSVIDPQPDHRAPALDPDGLPYIGIRDVNYDGTVNESTARMVSEKAVLKQEKAFTISDKDIVFCKVGTLGQPRHLNIEKKRVALSATLVLIKAKENCCERYLKHVLDSDYLNSQIYSVITGATRPALGIQQIRKFKLPFPPLMVQLQISRFLDRKTDKLDEAISIKEKQIELLRERKQILIQQAVTQGLNPNVAMKDSGAEWIGQIPEHWEMVKVKHIFNLVMEQSEKKNDHELLSVYTDIGVKPRRELEDRGNKASTTDGYWLVNKGDIVVNKLLAWMGAIGLSEYDGVTSPAYDILRPKVPVSGGFYHLLFRAPFCSAELKRHSRGIMDMRLRLYFDKFGNIEVPYPPKEEQDKIIAELGIKLGQVDNGIDLFEQQIKKLNEYKATLINSAVTGKIKVPEVA